MYCTSVNSVIGTARDASGEGWKSRRLLLASEGRPVSVHQTTVAAGSRLRFCYERHSETVYCIKGRATLTDKANGKTHSVGPGVLYSVTIGEDHQLDVEDECVFLCVFDPPLEGQEEAD
jgi:L-ectoine synthase